MYQKSKNSAKAFRTILDISEVSFVLKVFLLKSPNTSYMDGTIVFCIYLLLRTLPNHPMCLFLADRGSDAIKRFLFHFGGKRVACLLLGSIKGICLPKCGSANTQLLARCQRAMPTIQNEMVCFYIKDG